MPTGVPSEDRVKRVIAAVIERSGDGPSPRWQEIDSDFPLYSLEDGQDSLGLDSLDAVEIATELEEEFDVVLPVEIDPAELATVRQVTELLIRLRRQQAGGAG